MHEPLEPQSSEHVSETEAEVVTIVPVPTPVPAPAPEPVPAPISVPGDIVDVEVVGVDRRKLLEFTLIAKSGNFCSRFGLSVVTNCDINEASSCFIDPGCAFDREFLLLNLIELDSLL